MSIWNFFPPSQFTLPLAADARFCQTDYVNDHIWNISLGNSDPPAISLETTFGLRARVCRIFPRFICEGNIVNNPNDFFQPIKIHRYYPNYIEFTFKPFSHINVNLEFWVPDSHIVAGRTKIKNNGKDDCSFTIDWIDLLLPIADGIPMAQKEFDLIPVLTGKSSNLCPTFYLEGGGSIGKSPYPSLSLPIKLFAHQEKETRWVQASLEDMNSSYILARNLCNKNWDAEIANIRRINSKSIEILTGNKDWDIAFKLSKNISYQLVLSATQIDKTPSFVLTRNPDQGYSFLGNGADYSHLWNGQPPIESQYLMNLYMPESPELLKNILNNFLATQNNLGEIDLKPGLGGQLSHLLAAPVLADIALNYYEISNDLQYLKDICPKLIAFYDSWYSHAHDQDDDRFPEWDQLIQTGYEDHPLFSYQFSWSEGADISTVEAPDLLSYLYHEGNCLIRICELIGETENRRRLKDEVDHLNELIEQTWSDHDACYHRRDRDSHTIAPQELLGTCQGVGLIEINKEFPESIRPIFNLVSEGESTKACQIYIHGTGNSGTHRIEIIPSPRIRWIHERGFATSAYTYKSIEHIEIKGANPEDVITVKSLNTRDVDLSLSLPLWAGVPTPEKAKVLINLSLINKKMFLSPFGLRSYIGEITRSTNNIRFDNLYFPWISLILEGLVLYKERRKAAEVFQRMMKPVIASLAKDLNFRQYYHSETGDQSGTQNILTSLVPMGIFLKILGVKIYTPYKVELEGQNPFPWPVTVKYQGLTIIKHDRKTMVIFPDGQSVNISSDQKQLIERRRE